MYNEYYQNRDSDASGAIGRGVWTHNVHYKIIPLDAMCEHVRNYWANKRFSHVQ